MLIKQIIYYFQGKLSEEAMDFWKHLLMNEDDLELLETYGMLRQYYSAERESRHKTSP